MKFLLDHDVYENTARFLVNLGHDVLRVREIGLAQASDSKLLETAHRESRVFVTRDRDFGGLVFLQNFGAGVIYLRMLPTTQKVVHQGLARVLEDHSESELKNAFIVVEAGRHRFRRLAE